MSGVGRGGDVINRGVRRRRAVSRVMDARMRAGTGCPGREVVVCRREHGHVRLVGGVEGWLAALLLHHGVEHRAGDHRGRGLHHQRGA